MTIWRIKCKMEEKNYKSNWAGIKYMDVYTQVKAYSAPTKQEEESRTAFLAAWEKEGERLLYRTSSHHFVASAMVVTPALDKVLMVHHNQFRAFTWPGGHADGEVDLLDVALREVREETGIDKVYPLCAAPLSLDILQVGEYEKRGELIPEHAHYCLTFGFLASEKQSLIVKEDENSAVKWVAVSELEQVCTEAHMLPLYRKVYARICALQEEKEMRISKLSDALLPWYQGHARKLPWRVDTDPYHVWLSEIMLQQTRVEAVKGYYVRFLGELSTIKALAEAPQDRLLKLWEGLGYYTRVKNLQKAAKQILEKYGGRFPEQYAQVRALPGIGDYTAGAVCSICFGQPEPAVDGNVLRVMARVAEIYEPIDTPRVKRWVTEALRAVYPHGKCGDFTQSLMELGATVCLPNGEPQCDVCPLRSICMAYADGVADSLPKRTPKRQRRVERRTVYILLHGDRVALCRREESGLLGGLWEFPNELETRTENDALGVVKQWGTEPTAIVKKISRKHIFSHVEWHMEAYYICCGAENGPFTWGSRAQLQTEIALPTAFGMFVKELD